jgi:nucleoside-triphosphatase THEP1
MEVIIISGEINSGKTTLMKKNVDKEKRKSQGPTGIIAPGIFKQDLKVGFNVEDISSGKIKLLASVEEKYSVGFSFGRFNFFKEGFEFAKKALLNFKPKGVVFLDEAGPLELSGKGYADCLKALLCSNISRLYVSVRKDCLKEFIKTYLSSDKLKVNYLTT